MANTKPRFFRTPAELRRWLSANQAKADELVVGFYKKGAGRKSVTYQEALDEALCFGWIDGLTRGGETHYSIRFTPRRARSFWSAVNIARVGELEAQGRMRPSGRAAFERRDQSRTDRFVSERAAAALTPGEKKRIKANAKAWKFFEAAAPSYRRNVVWWIASAKKPETRAKRLDDLIAYAVRGMRVPPLTPPARDTKR